MSRFPQFLHNLRVDGGVVVSLKRRQSDTHFCLGLSKPQGHSADGKIKKKLRSLSHRANYTEKRPPFVGKVSGE
jgi:hypothetical protein